MVSRIERRKAGRDDEAVDSAFEVPAAVLCAFCGEAECTGCTAADDGSSGVLAIVPWERPGAGAWTRLWATANQATRNADAFFAALPDGDLPPAVRFAVLAEMLAVTSMVAILVPVVALILPSLALQIVHDPGLRSTAVRWMLVGVPALAGWMVVAHATHGAALDVGARGQGVSSQRRRAVRFGLYACGWDLMAMPIGLFVTMLSKGLRSTADLVNVSMQVPGKASAALLEGVYHLAPDQVRRARRVGGLAAVAITLVSGALVVGLAIVGTLHH